MEYAKRVVIYVLGIVTGIVFTVVALWGYLVFVRAGVSP